VRQYSAIESAAPAATHASTSIVCATQSTQKPDARRAPAHDPRPTRPTAISRIARVAHEPSRPRRYPRPTAHSRVQLVRPMIEAADIIRRITTPLCEKMR